MQFIYNPLAGQESIELEGEKFKHLVKARRKKAGISLHVRNLQDDFLYLYKLENIGKHKAQLSLISKEKNQKNSSNLNLGWAVVDPKTIEKTLPFLNEIGVKKLNFVYTDFSQKNFKLDLDRMKRILINSSEQCGRSTLLGLEIYEDLESFLKVYPTSYILDFGGKNIEQNAPTDSILVGCEGGFSQKEREMFGDKILGFQSQLILKSQTAICSLGAKLLL